jgi:hypothetical protein
MHIAQDDVGDGPFNGWRDQAALPECIEINRANRLNFLTGDESNIK